MDNTYTVRLMRGVTTKVWNEATLRRAQVRASALADLHYCEYTHDEATNTFTINASGYYNNGAKQ
jgi:hypothetical protein